MSTTLQDRYNLLFLYVQNSDVTGTRWGPIAKKLLIKEHTAQTRFSRFEVAFLKKDLPDEDVTPPRASPGTKTKKDSTAKKPVKQKVDTPSDAIEEDRNLPVMPIDEDEEPSVLVNDCGSEGGGDRDVPSEENQDGDISGQEDIPEDDCEG